MQFQRNGFAAFLSLLAARRVGHHERRRSCNVLENQRGKELEDLVTKQLRFKKLEVEEKKCKGQWKPTDVWKEQGFDAEAMERDDPNFLGSIRSSLGWANNTRSASSRKVA